MKTMRLASILALFIVAALAGLTAAPPAAAQEDPADYGMGIARVSYLTGDVLFNSEEDDEWAAVSPNFPLRNGDRLWAGEDSRLEVRFATGETAWLNYDSELEVVSLRRDDDGNAYQLALTSGEASFDVKNFDVLGSVFQVDTPNTSVRAFGKALFRLTSLADGTTQVGVNEGSVEVESEYGVANVHPGEMLEVYPDGRSRIMDLPGIDDWEDWVESRLDRYERTYRSERYLPAEMRDYAYEFDEGGRWVSYPEYGNVWVPSVSVGWSPYSNGRWVWSGWDYVWLPYDPWYSPFHYGRWRWTVRFGWCWVPPVHRSVFWSPGYVGWVWDADYVYWVPLAPREVYFGFGYYGPNSVNIYKTNIVVNKNVYINSDARDGVVVVNRDNFLKGKTKRVKEVRVVERFKKEIVKKEVIREKIIKEKVVVGAPPAKAIKPVRETRHPKPEVKVVKERIPKKVVERKKFVKERRVVKGEVKSAFEPTRKPRHMKDLERLNKPEFKRNGGEKKIEKQTREREKREIIKEEKARERDTRKEIRREKDEERAIKRERVKEEKARERVEEREKRETVKEQKVRERDTGKDTRREPTEKRTIEREKRETVKEKKVRERDVRMDTGRGSGKPEKAAPPQTGKDRGKEPKNPEKKGGKDKRDRDQGGEEDQQPE